MKRIFTLLVFFTVLLAAFADAATRVTISASSKYNLRVLVDGQVYNDRNSNYEDDIVINNLRPGYHSIKIYQLARNSNPRPRMNGYGTLLYEGNVYVKQQYHIDITINRFGKAFVDERAMTGGYDNDRWDNDGWDNNNGGWGNGQAMSSRNFEQLKVTLVRENFDNSRLTLAKQSIAANLFTSVQMKELANLFAFDASKLELAKYGYNYTTDKQNYFILNDVFTYSASKEELARFIRQQR